MLQYICSCRGCSLEHFLNLAPVIASLRPVAYSHLRERHIFNLLIMGIGRFICVGMPFALTGCSLVCILIVMLAGVTNNSLYMFSVDTKDLSIPVIDLSSLERCSQRIDLIGSGIAGAVTSGGSSLQGNNVTAADLGLFDSYTISL
jgi:hypothetical protein